MSEFEKIGSIVRLRKFSPVIDLQWAETPGDESGLGLIGSYIVTGELAGYFENVLESFTLQRHEKKALREGAIPDVSIHPRAHMLRGQYGTGKSYFLLMVSAFIEALGDNRLFDELYEKFRVFENIRFHMDGLRKAQAKYLVVRIDGVKNIDMRFHELVQKSVMNRIKKVFGDDSFSGSYENAVRKLEEYLQDGVFSGLLLKKLESRGISYDTLLSGLKASQRNSLRDYREIMEEITRHKLDEGFDSLEAFLRSASDYVKSKGYYGIVILIDEFSAYVKNSIEDKRITADLAAIQSLAQLTAPREGRDLFFVCSMHVDLLSILGGATETAEEIRKVRGRFSEMTLTFGNSENLVENILSVDRTGFARLNEKYRRYFGALPTRYPDMDKVYPIHPHTVKSIIRVSGKYAQNERTIFSFFAQAVNRKLNEPVIIDERLNLITTGEIYDYFIDSISERNILLKESAMRCLSFCSNSMERDIVKALVIAQVSADADSDARLSSTDIAFIIGADNIKSIDMFLKEMNANPASNIIFYESYNRFEFIAAGNMMNNISALLESELEKTEGYEALLEALDEYANGTCIRKTYTVNPSRDILPVRKDLEGVIYRPADLLNALGREMQNVEKDGKLLFIVPGFNDTISEELFQTLKARLLLAPTNICAAVPKSFPVQLERDLRLHSAAKNILKAGKLDENGKKMLQKIHSPIEKNIENEIKKFANTSNFTFIFSDETVIEEFSSLDELYGFILRKHYSKFPRIDAEAIRGKNSIHMLVDNFLALGGMTNIPEKYSSELEKLIMDVMRPLDLVRVERSGSGHNARLKIPEESKNRESWEIWQIVNNTSRAVREVFALLGAAPFGLPDYMVELYIAVAVAANQLTINYKGHTMQLNRMSIALVNSPGYTLEKVKTARPELKSEVKKVWSVFSRIHGRCGAKSFEPGLAQSDSAVHALLAADMADIRVLLSGFEARLENAGIMNETLLGLLKSATELGTVPNPVDYMEVFVLLPKKVCAIQDDATAFQRFDEYFAFLAELNAGLDGIWKIETVLGSMRSLEGDGEEFGELKAIYFEVLGWFDNLKKSIRDNIYLSEMVTELKGRLSKLILSYNETFIQLHEKVSKETHKLLDMFESPSVKLIEAFERIKFKDIKKISDIRGEMRGIRACSLHPVMRDDEPVNCTCTGFHDGLSELTGQLHIVKRMEDSFCRQISNIGGNHVTRLKSLEFYPDKPDIQKEWISLTEYLQDGFDEIVRQSVSDVISLAESLAPHINAYLTRVEVEKKKTEAEIKAKKKIGFRTLYTQIQSEITNMGYKSVSVEEFARTLQRIIDRIRKEYDEIDIGE